MRKRSSMEFFPSLFFIKKFLLVVQLFLIVFFSSLNTVHSQTPLSNPNDRHVLLSFKSSISHDPSGILSSWNDSSGFCQWHGVSCGRRHPEKVTALDLNSLKLAGFISPFLANLTFLRRLSLSDNQLRGEIPKELGLLPRLRHLDLSFNSLEGEIPRTLSHCSKLQIIVLMNNFIGGEVPRNLSSCQDLRLINLSSNKLVGHIPNEFGSFPKLEVLILVNNYLTGSIPPSLSNLSSLSHLQLSHNFLSGEIPPSLGKLSSLTILTMSFNELSGVIPSSFNNLSSIYNLSLSGNYLNGTLPRDFGFKLFNLQYIYMYSNLISGIIPASLFNVTGLNTVDLSDNNFHGPIPENLGSLPSLTWLSFFKNHIEANGWKFLVGLANSTRLRVLQLHDNQLGGTLPSSLGNLSAHMEWLTLAWNGISGSIPAEIGNLVNLTAIYIGNNLLTGTIPSTIGKLKRLDVLSLSSNHFSGEIPSSIGNLTQVSRIYLARTEITGSIPKQLGNCNNLELLDLSHNKLSGSIPKEVVSISSLSRYLHLSHNSLTGSLPLEVGRLKNLKEFDVSENALSGEIPSSLGSCQVMEILLMSGNKFQGTIPDSLRDLKGIQELDFSRNNLSGRIPDFFGNFHFLQNLNLSYNHFEGEVPTGGVFQNASAVSVAGNAELCGGSEAYKLPPCSTGSTSYKHKSHQAIAVIISVIGAVVCLLLLLVLVTICILWIKRSRYKSPSVASLEHYAVLSYAQLFKATDGFSEANLIGVGSFGSVYKGVLPEIEEAIAVKVLNIGRQGAIRTFMAECEALRNIRHRNLMKILNTCSSIDLSGNEFRCLVFEYMPNGSLEQWLHPQEGRSLDSRNLDLKQRLNIAIDIAQALDYLHHHCHATIIHCDLKPSNVLLDSDMKAIVSDFGLARFYSKFVTHAAMNSVSSVQIKGTIGYIAPEYGMGTKASTQGDVYSYGILILEMFTGKRPTDDDFNGSLSLHQFVKMAFPKKVMDIFDPCLLLDEDDGEETEEQRAKIEECLVSVIRVGLSCSQESPRERMGMGVVVKEMQAIRDAFFEGKSYADQ